MGAVLFIHYKRAIVLGTLLRFFFLFSLLFSSFCIMYIPRHISCMQIFKYVYLLFPSLDRDFCLLFDICRLSPSRLSRYLRLFRYGWIHNNSNELSFLTMYHHTNDMYGRFRFSFSVFFFFLKKGFLASLSGEKRNLNYRDRESRVDDRSKTCGEHILHLIVSLV